MSEKRKKPFELQDEHLKDRSEGKQANDTSARAVRHRYSSIIISTVVIIVMVVILSIGMAFSWFAPKEDADLTVITTDFELEAQYKLSSSASDFVELTDKVNFDVKDLNQLQLQIKYTGPSSAYIRVQLFESFNKGEIFHPATDITYTLSPDWVKIGDYYYYKKVASYKEELVEEDGKLVNKRNSNYISFVTSASSKYDEVADSDVTMNLVAVVEAVQPDRFQDFFLPEKDPVYENIDPDEFFKSNS